MKQLSAVPPIPEQQPAGELKPVNAGAESHIELCTKCTLPDCNESSPQCLIQIQKRAA